MTKLAPFMFALALATCQMPLRDAAAQIQRGPNLSANGLPFLFSPRAGYLGPPVAVHNGFRAPFPFVYPRTGRVSIPVPGGPPPMAPLPPPEAPPLAYAPPPPPPPLGWVFLPYTACLEPDCRTLIVSVGADGLNVRVAPNGPVILALVNGTPLIPLRGDGRWALVTAACNLAPTGLWSWTANVSLGGCL
jgi:hypothetical protein